MQECHICYEEITLLNNYTCEYNHLICSKCILLVYDINSNDEYKCPYCNKITILLKIVPIDELNNNCIKKWFKKLCKNIKKIFNDNIINVTNNIESNNINMQYFYVYANQNNYSNVYRYRYQNRNF